LVSTEFLETNSNVSYDDMEDGSGKGFQATLEGVYLLKPTGYFVTVVVCQVVDILESIITWFHEEENIAHD